MVCEVECLRWGGSDGPVGGCRRCMLFGMGVGLLWAWGGGHVGSGCGVCWVGVGRGGSEDWGKCRAKFMYMYLWVGGLWKERGWLVGVDFWRIYGVEGVVSGVSVLL